ncbi:MAG: sulfotransferase [Gammaproteobacteria bacterium]
MNLPTVKFVLCGLPRSGTTVVAGSLLTHPQVLFYGELLNDLEGVRRNEASRITLGAGWQIANQANQALRACGLGEDGYGYLSQFFALETNARALGFKLQLDQAAAGPNHTAWRYLEEHDELRIVRTRRENLLDVVCSYVRARITRRWHTPAGAVDSPRFVLPPHECEPLFERFDAAARVIEGFEQTHRVLDVDYADIETAFAETMARVFSFLDLDTTAPAEPRLKKIAQGTPATEIANYAELAQHFADTRFARHFVY